MRSLTFIPRRLAWIPLAFAVVSCPGREAHRAEAPAGTIGDVRRLMGDRATGERSIDVTGVVTYFDHGHGRVYIEDGTGAVAIDVGELEAPVTAGARIRLSGVIVPGSRPLRLFRPQLTVQGQASPEWMPEPRPIDAPALLAGEGEALWVVIHGLVISTQNRGSLLAMQVEDRGRRFVVHIANLDQTRYPPIAGARVRLEGVSAVAEPAEAEAPHLLLPDVGYMRLEADPPVATPTSALPLLETARDVRLLSAAEAEKHYPVRLRAVVTYSDPEMRLLFVHDGTGGIYVEAWRHIHYVKVGDLVEVVGISNPGAFAPIVDRPRLRVLGRGTLPAALRVAALQLVKGQYDSQWVELQGVIRTVSARRPGAVLSMDAEGVPVSVEIPEAWSEALVPRFVNARVRARGVCRSIFTLKGQLASVALNSPSLDAIAVVVPPPTEPFALPVQAVKSLLQFQTGQTWEHRVRVQGVVTYSQKGILYIRDRTGGVLVRIGHEAAPAIGEELDVIGFAAPGEYSPVLQDAETRVIGTGVLAPPAAITAEQAQSGQYDSELVTIDARLLDSVRTAGELQLSLQSGPYLFTATLPGGEALPARVGSRLRLTGICAVSTDPQRLPQGFRILLRHAADAFVLTAAPFWTPQRAAWGVAALAALALLSFVWGILLRRTVAAQSAIIWQRVKHETELEERQRIARELHDSLEQNLTGASLSLGAARLMASKTTQQHLTNAIEAVRASIAEVHRVVWALRDELIDARGLPAALDGIGQQLAGCCAEPVRVRTKVLGRPHPFAVAVENDLLRIGQEALTNAVKHGHATSIEVELLYEPGSFCLRVRDNGRGFDAEAPSLPGHFGLVGMRERARQIGARLSVQSAIGRGTVVEVVVPIPSVVLQQTG